MVVTHDSNNAQSQKWSIQMQVHKLYDRHTKFKKGLFEIKTHYPEYKKSCKYYLKGNETINCHLQILKNNLNLHICTMGEIMFVSTSKREKFNRV